MTRLLTPTARTTSAWVGKEHLAFNPTRVAYTKIMRVTKIWGTCVLITRTVILEEVFVESKHNFDASKICSRELDQADHRERGIPRIQECACDRSHYPLCMRENIGWKCRRNPCVEVRKPLHVLSTTNWRECFRWDGHRWERSRFTSF